MSYVAPELLDGKTADARSDVFSLGVVMYELLSGKQLFVGENDLDTLRLVREMEIPPPSARNPGVKRALDAIVMRALERDPQKRYQSAGEMGDDLETVVLRERYSTRALARKVRELADLEEAPAQSSGPIVEETIEVPDSGALLISESHGVPLPVAGARSSSSPVAAEAVKRPATPPRLPPQRERGGTGGRGAHGGAALGLGRGGAAHRAGAGAAGRDRAPAAASARRRRLRRRRRRCTSRWTRRRRARP